MYRHWYSTIRTEVGKSGTFLRKYLRGYELRRHDWHENAIYILSSNTLTHSIAINKKAEITDFGFILKFRTA